MKGKEKLQSLMLWGVVAYSLVILSYFTLKTFGHTADFVSAFGSILAATATFFAAYVAIYLYSDWKEPALYEIKKENAYEVLKLVSENYFYLLRIREVLDNISKVDRYKIISSSYLKHPTISRDDFFEKNRNIRILDKISPSKNFLSIYANYERHVSYVNSDYLKIMDKYEKYYEKILERMGNAEKIITLKQGDRFSAYPPNEKAPCEAFILLKAINNETGFYVGAVPDEEKCIYPNFLRMLNKTIDIHEQLEKLLIGALSPQDD